MLTLRAERSEETEGKHRSEFRYGSFARSVRLPAGARGDQANADYKDGILQPRKQETAMECNRGDRVQYKGPGLQKRTGGIQRVQGRPPQVRYTVRDEQTNVEEQIEDRQIERAL